MSNIMLYHGFSSMKFYSYTFLVIAGRVFWFSVIHSKWTLSFYSYNSQMIRHKCLIPATILPKRLVCQKKTRSWLTSHFLICSRSRFTQLPATPTMSISPVGMRAGLLGGWVFFLLCYGFKPARCWTLIPAEAINEFWLLSHDWAMTWHLDLLHGGSVSPFWTLICSRWLWPMNKVYFYSSITRKGSRMLSFLSLSDVDTIVLKVMKNTFVL